MEKEENNKVSQCLYKNSIVFSNNNISFCTNR